MNLPFKISLPPPPNFTQQQPLKKEEPLPRFHPMTELRRWNGKSFRISHAATGVICFGATGSGKSSAVGKELGLIYLAEGFGFVVLCAKKEEVEQWVRWSKLTHRTDDLRIVDASGTWRFNFMDCEGKRGGEGAGLTINTVALLDEVAAATLGGGAGEGGGENKFFDGSLHLLNTNIVDLALLSGVGVSMPVMRDIAASAPVSAEQASSKEWLEGDSVCALLLRAADAATKDADEDTRGDYEECRRYWTKDWPELSDRTKSIVQLMFSMLVRPFVTRPLKRLFSSDTNLTPEDAFNGRIIVINLPVQEFRTVGKVANIVWKYCTQIAIMRRVPPTDGTFLRPVCIWGDEYQNFATPFDTVYQAVARSAAGCTVALTQTREAIRRVLGDSDTTDSLLANLQAKFFCQNTGDTNEWASKSVLGEAWTDTDSISINQQQQEGEITGSTGVSTSKQLRRYVDPSQFTTLKRGGQANNFIVQCIFYNGGETFPYRYNGRFKALPYQLLEFDQRKEIK